MQTPPLPSSSHPAHGPQDHNAAPPHEFIPPAHLTDHMTFPSQVLHPPGNHNAPPEQRMASAPSALQQNKSHMQPPGQTGQTNQPPEPHGRQDSGASETPDPQNKPMKAADYYQLIRQRMQNEDELVNQRLIWMVFSQSFMFSAFAAVTNAPEKPKSPVMGSHQDLLLWIIPLIALLASGLIYIGLITSMLSAKGLRLMYEKYPKDESVAYFPPIQNLSWVRWLSAMAPALLPLLFISTWLFILLNQIIQSGRAI